jgi:ppGpp synthetase/RelA/SpoT-type nucleotidyltranferase
VEISKTKIDRLGDRLRKGNITDDDLRLLDEYRRSLTGAYEDVVGTIRDRLGLEPTGRPAKSTTSIAEKLRRESIRLTQVQDIAGCRLIVVNIAEQDRVVTNLVRHFIKTTVVDRRAKPSHGYRAVHVIATIDDKAVEIQARTVLQQLWAELSEKISDTIDPAIKYGGGQKDIQGSLLEVSIIIAQQENLEPEILEVHQEIENALSSADLTDEERTATMGRKQRVVTLQARYEAAREDVLKALREALE